MTESGASGSNPSGWSTAGRDRMIQHLATVGLNLFACLSGRDLVAQTVPGLCNLEADTQTFNGMSLERQTFILIGNAGPSFWSACQASDCAQLADPVDSFSQQQVACALNRFIPEVEYRVLYPGTDCMIPLQTLGAMAGWHKPSPLGIGMHPRAGLWFAYRALVLLNVEWTSAHAEPPAREAGDAMITDHCAVCETLDCIKACPAAALQIEKTPDLYACAEYRLEEGSSCQQQCLSRNACPVYPQQRYSQDQTRHHYVASLESLRRYIQQDQADV